MSQVGEDVAHQHACQECGRVYSTAGHLRRHQITHSQQKSAQCRFCSRSFVKSDVARRHAVSCARKQQADAPPQAKRGRKARACDRCAVKKISCDTSSPCSRCTSLGMPCSYRRSHGQSGSHGAEHNGAPFLLSLVDTSFQSSAAALAAADPYTDPASAASHAEWQLFPDDASYFGWNFAGLFGIWSDPGHANYSGLGQLPLSDDNSLHLRVRLDDAVHELATVQQSTRVSDTSTPGFDYDLARSVFTAANLSSFLSGYFNRYHQHLPIIHRPTFVLEAASTPLLLAIFAVGLAASESAQSTPMAPHFLGLIEEFIFSQNPFRRYLCRKNDYAAAAQTSREIEVLQAALIISTIQTSMHDIPTRRRVRVERHPTLVAVVRASRLFTATRERAKGSWEEFVEDEVRIRLGTFTILYDNHMCLFYNNPPLVSVAEMIGDMPCDEELFEAETAIEFERTRTLELPREGLSMCGFINMLARGKLPTRRPLVQLRAAILAMAGAVYTARTGVLASEQLSVVFRATEKWKLLWGEATAAAEAKGILPSRAWRHAAEICWLLQAIVEAALGGDLDCPYMQSFARDSLAAVGEFIREHKTL